MRSLLIWLFVLMILHSPALCQKENGLDINNSFRKNVIYGATGFSISQARFLYNVNYERQITHPVKYPVGTFKIDIRAGLGAYEGLLGIGNICLLSANFVFGKSAGHFETNLGAVYMYNMQNQDSDKTTGITPLINMGYRFQKESGFFVLRAGIGWPEGIYVSLGVAF
jgi:hypothetical protein